MGSSLTVILKGHNQIASSAAKFAVTGVWLVQTPQMLSSSIGRERTHNILWKSLPSFCIEAEVSPTATEWAKRLRFWTSAEGIILHKATFGAGLLH